MRSLYGEPALGPLTRLHLNARGLLHYGVRFGMATAAEVAQYVSVFGHRIDKEENDG